MFCRCVPGGNAVVRMRDLLTERTLVGGIFSVNLGLDLRFCSMDKSASRVLYRPRGRFERCSLEFVGAVIDRPLTAVTYKRFRAIDRPYIIVRFMVKNNQKG